MREISNGVDSSESEDNLRRAEIMLASLGMVLEDLRKFGLVLDIGARGCEVEKAARSVKINSVVSVDRSFPKSIIDSGMKVIQSDAKNLDLEDNKVDLALVRASAYFYTQTEEETWAILNNINRILKKDGEQRIYPARFGHIVNGILKEINSGRSEESWIEGLSDMDPKDTNFYNNLANIRSVEFLEQRGIFVKKREGITLNANLNFKEYLAVPKF